MGTISGTTYIKIFIFLPGTGKHITGSALQPEKSHLENKEAMKWVPLFLPNNQETPSPEWHKHDGKSEVVHHLTGKLFSHSSVPSS
jgi:hypothetical protein